MHTVSTSAHLDDAGPDVVRAVRASVLGLMLAALAAGGAGCGQTASSGGPAAGGPGGAAPAMPVEMITLAPHPVEQIGEFVGTIKSRRQTMIQPQAEGILTSIAVKSGDHVTPGQLLAQIDSTPQQAAVASLESTRAAREADATLAHQQAQRAKAMLDAGAGTAQDYEQAAAQEKSAQAQLKAVDDQIRQQQAELAYYRVVAPTAGVVGDVPVRVGDAVTKSTKITTIDDNNGLEVYVNVPVQEAARLHVGMPLRLVNDAGGTIVEEPVSFVSASVDDTTQTVLVKANLAGETPFRSDQFVRVHLVWSTEPALTIPVTSVLRINGQFFAFVAVPGANGALTAHQQAVTLGPVQGNDYVVLSGLAAGDRLITGGLQKIGDGSPVQALPSRASGPPPGGGAAGGRGGR